MGEFLKNLCDHLDMGKNYDELRAYDEEISAYVDTSSYISSLKIIHDILEQTKVMRPAKRFLDDKEEFKNANHELIEDSDLTEEEKIMDDVDYEFSCINRIMGDYFKKLENNDNTLSLEAVETKCFSLIDYVLKRLEDKHKGSNTKIEYQIVKAYHNVNQAHTLYSSRLVIKNQTKNE
jgi:hypothetical protein